jgi:hypothetical protein
MDKKVLLTFLAGTSCLIAPATEVRAITAEVAKKCQVLTSAAFPPRVPGNPAAGSAKGSGRQQNDYFKKCVASGGQPPERDQQKNSP